MGDRFRSLAEANAYARGLGNHMLRALVTSDEPDEEGLFRVISPDLDYMRPDRVWDSAEQALGERLAPQT